MTSRLTNAISETVHGRRLAVLDAPSNLGLRPPAPGKEPGVKEMARVLRTHGLLLHLHAADAGTVVPPQYSGKIAPATRVRNAAEIRTYNLQLAEKVQEQLAQNSFPIVLGGDCSILLGIAQALHQRGRYGLLFIDGHSDLLTPETSQTGGIAGMDLAIVTGTVANLASGLGIERACIKPQDTVVFGYRWPAPEEQIPATPSQPFTAMPLSRIRQQEIASAAKNAVTYLGKCGEGFWLHLDVDVLSPEWMSAVDSPDPGGMTPEELLITLKIALSSAHCVGMNVTIYDPTLDPEGKGAKLLVNLLTDSFAQL